MTESEYSRWCAKERRSVLAAKKLCINGEPHGEATHGVRCAWCYAVHKFGAVVAFRMGVARPPGHRVRNRSGALW